MRIHLALVTALLCSALPASANDMAAATLAKFIRIVLQSTGVPAIACANKEIAGELANLGVALAADSKVAWVDNPIDLARVSRQKKLAICGNRSFLATGASLAIVPEGGRPVIYVNLKALGETGITLPDSFMKISKAAQ